MSKYFFKTLAETADAFREPRLTFGAKKEPPETGPEGERPNAAAPTGSPRPKRPRDSSLSRTQALVRIAVSLALFALGGYLLVSGNDEQGKIGAGFVGTVAGYWLR